VLLVDTLKRKGELLGAALLTIAHGEPFNSPQVLWIHFLVSAPP
jgi:hypothetical protein